MKPIKYLSIIFTLIIALLFLNACGTGSHRKTPIVKVVVDYAPAVVNIRTEMILDLKESPEWGLYGEAMDAFFKKYFGENYSEGILKHKSLGSGVILNNNGLIVTNAHVVQKATNIYVVLKDGTILEADILDVNTQDDLALIKTDLPSHVKEVKFANIDELMVGETVIAIGNPLGLENSVTVGVISGKERSFRSLQCEYECSGLIQTDASINPGNSGGALLNLDGELVGVNLAVVQEAQNIGFAVPVNKIDTMVKQHQ